MERHLKKFFPKKKKKKEKQVKQSKDIYQSLYNSTHFNKIFLEKKMCSSKIVYFFFLFSD